VREPNEARAVGVHEIDLWMAVARGDEGDGFSGSGGFDEYCFCVISRS